MQNRVGLICGRRGSGKSTTAKEIACYEPRLFVFDPNGEYSDLVRYAVTDDDKFADFIDEVSDRDTFAVRWVPQYDPVDDAEFFCEEVFEEKPTNAGTALRCWWTRHICSLLLPRTRHQSWGAFCVLAGMPV